MLDTTAHMLLLLQQAKIKNERPEDASFLPLSLSLACLLRQLPAGLAPPAGGLSFHQLDRLPQSALERKLAALLLDDPVRAFNFVCAIVRYAKATRALLTVCHEHLANRKTTVEAMQSVVQAVVDVLTPPSSPEGARKRPGDEKSKRPEASNTVKQTPVETPADTTPVVQSTESSTEKPTSAVATDPAGIMRRAVGRDVGDGSAVLAIMRKYPGDVRLQSHGVRALKGVVRSSKATMSRDTTTPSGLNEEASGSKAEIEFDEPTREASLRVIVQMVLDRMKKFPEALALQRDGLLCLAEYANQKDSHVAVITSSGGIISVVNAMVALPDDVPANLAGLSVLGHPMIADESVVRVNPESRRLVLSAMKRFPLNEQVQGLGCLALANLSLRQDASMLEIVSRGGLEAVLASMSRFRDAGLVQAAGCWLVAIVSAKSDDMRTACLDAGALPVCEKARLHFPDDPKVQQHAVQAVHNLLPEDAVREDELAPPGACALQ